MPQSDCETRNIFETVTERGAKDFAYFTAVSRYRRDVVMRSIHSFTKPVGIERCKQITSCTPPRVSYRDDAQFLNSRHCTVDGMLSNPQFFGSPLAGSVKLLTKGPDIVRVQFKYVTHNMVRGASRFSNLS